VGPLVVAGLAAAGILATGGLGIALAAVLAGVLLATGCAGGAAPGRRGRGAHKARAHRPADSSAMAKNAALSAAGTAIPRGFG